MISLSWPFWEWKISVASHIAWNIVWHSFCAFQSSTVGKRHWNNQIRFVPVRLCLRWQATLWFHELVFSVFMACIVACFWHTSISRWMADVQIFVLWQLAVKTEKKFSHGQSPLILCTRKLQWYLPSNKFKRTREPMWDKEKLPPLRISWDKF